MIACERCGQADNPDDARFCKSCGSKLLEDVVPAAQEEPEEIACSRCGRLNEEGSRSCCECGSDLSWATPGAAPARRGARIVAPPPPPQPAAPSRLPLILGLTAVGCLLIVVAAIALGGFMAYRERQERMARMRAMQLEQEASARAERERQALLARIEQLEATDELESLADKNPDEQVRQAARQRLTTVTFEAAKKTGSVKELEAFAARFPGSSEAIDARKLADDLRAEAEETELLSKAIAENTDDAAKAYLDRFAPAPPKPEDEDAPPVVDRSQGLPLLARAAIHYLGRRPEGAAAKDARSALVKLLVSAEDPGKKALGELLDASLASGTVAVRLKAGEGNEAYKTAARGWLERGFKHAGFSVAFTDDDEKDALEVLITVGENRDTKYGNAFAQYASVTASRGAWSDSWSVGTPHVIHYPLVKGQPDDEDVAVATAGEIDGVPFFPW